MTFNKRTSISILAALILLVILLAFIEVNLLNSKPELDYKPNNTYTETITVVADGDYQPFSFIDDDGQALGSDIEILYAIANEMQVNVDLTFLTWPQPVDEVIAGNADVVLGIEYVQYYLDRLALTEPIESNQFVLFGKEEYASLQELQCKRIGTIPCSATYSLFTKPNGLEDEMMIFDSYEEGFAAILNNELDYFVGKYPVGNRVILKEGFKQIKAVGSVVANDAICFGVNIENTDLQNRMNEAINSLSQQGIITGISNKWLGDFSKALTLKDYIEKNLIYIVFSIMIISIIFAINILYKFKKMKYVAQMDMATGVYNKKAVENKIDKKLKNISRGCLCLIDLDDLKSINDTFGHPVGDRCIAIVAKVLADTFRDYDIVGRLGGDEFIVYAENLTDKSSITNKFNNLQKSLEKKRIDDDKLPILQISAGAAITDTPISFEKLYEITDKALYDSKNKGKNKITILDVKNHLIKEGE